MSHRPAPATPTRRRQRGAALLTAMVIVTLVATLAASMIWQQWRAVQIEAAERSRAQHRRRGGETKVLQMERGADPHGKLTYPVETKMRLFRHLYRGFQAWHRQVFFFKS